jgi:2-keto-myo-inositol isomerase
MQLGFHGATTMTSTLETDVEVAAQAGWNGLEVWAEKVDTYLKTHTIEELAALFKAHAIQPLALDAIVFIAFRGAEYAQIQARCRELSHIAKAIGCPTIVVVASPLPERSFTWSAVVEEYVTVLRDLAAIAAEDGIRLSFEFLGFGWCSVRTARAAFEIVQKVDRSNIGMTIDAAHFYAGGGLLRELEELDAAKIFAFHLNDLADLPKEAITDEARVMPGDGVIPLGEICVRLKQIGYNGHASVELFNQDYWAQDALSVSKKARQKAVQILLPYYQVINDRPKGEIQ